MGDYRDPVAVADDCDLCRGGGIVGRPHVPPLPVCAAPERLLVSVVAARLAVDTVGDETHPVDGDLHGGAPATRDQMDLPSPRIETRALAVMQQNGQLRRGAVHA